MLQFDNSWRYESPGKLSNTVQAEFIDIIRKLARGEQEVLEHFKNYFAAAAGSAGFKVNKSE